MNTTKELNNNLLNLRQLFLERLFKCVSFRFKKRNTREFFYRKEKEQFLQELDDRTKWRSFMK